MVAGTNLIPCPIQGLFHLTLTTSVFVLRPMAAQQTGRKQDTAKPTGRTWLDRGPAAGERSLLLQQQRLR